MYFDGGISALTIVSLVTASLLQYCMLPIGCCIFCGFVIPLLHAIKMTHSNARAKPSSDLSLYVWWMMHGSENCSSAMFTSSRITLAHDYLLAWTRVRLVSCCGQHRLKISAIPSLRYSVLVRFGPTSLVLFILLSYEYIHLYSCIVYAIQLYCLVNSCVLYSNSELVDKRITIIYALESPPATSGHRYVAFSET
jgi:hypothetical protein